MADSPSPVLSFAESRRVFEAVERAAKSLGVTDVEALIAGHRDALTRFANNTIHQNVAEQAQWLSVRVALDHRTARATTNRFSEDSIQQTVEQAIALAKAVAPDPDLLPLAEPDSIPQIPRHDPPTAEASPRERAQIVAEVIRLVEAAQQTAAGIYSTGETVEAILNSRGLAAWHGETLA